MAQILLIRHGRTQGNLERRYIGRTDEALCTDGKTQIAALAAELPDCDRVYTSPMLRCRQTAAILFPNYKATIIPDLKECDFGIFEGRTADEMSDDHAYRAWVDANCAAPIPGGDDIEAFKDRSAKAFADIAFALPDDCTAAFVLHGGNIMAVLECFIVPKRDFYDYHLPNGGWVLCKAAEGTLCL